MNRKYEGIIIFDTKGTDGGIEELISSVSKEIQAGGGKVGATNDLGRRTFAYAPKKVESGHYVSFPFTAESSAIEKIQARLRLNTHVFQQYYQRLA